MTEAEFEALILEVLGVQRAPNAEQVQAIQAGIETPTLIVAGPGSGKTSVLVLRALRHILVDRMRPETILVTTFTKKAAKEIRTRLLEWGEPLVERAMQLYGADSEYLAFLELADVNRVVTGTLDSICQEALGEQRAPGERRYVVIEGFAADVLLSRVGQVFDEAQTVPELDSFLQQFSMMNQAPRNMGDRVRSIRTIIDRFIQDEVDIDAYVTAPGDFPLARQALKRIFDRYVTYMLAEHRMDFALLERTFLERVAAGQVPDTVANLAAILVDEYQDTNPLQERLYLELARATGAALTVVGDDDQSLYRFRGATIELFRAFRARAQEVLGLDCGDPIYLVQNYRSSPEIVQFYNCYILNDPDFHGARIVPPKPQITATRPSANMPILGLFRDDADQLADALAQFLHQIFRAGGRPADAMLPEAIQPYLNGGDLGDAVLLSSSVAEFTSANRERLPSKLRGRMEALGLPCFNPRGRALRDVPEVQQLLGCVLLALDPGPQGLSLDGVSGMMRLTSEAHRAMLAWRDAAAALLASNPAPVRGRTIQSVIARWRDFAVHGGGPATEWPLLDVFYAFVPWLPGFRDDPEGQVYLEAISRCAAQAASFSSYRGLLIRDLQHRQPSINIAIRDALAPIAEDLVDVDEEIMPSVPRTFLNMMTIHQAKGLEFPLVIVDLASDYTRNNHMQAFRRFPRAPSPACLMEDALAGATPIGPLRMQRTAIQRSFEDLIRLHYVAFSRPQSLLVLTGCRPTLRYGSTIKHVGMGWRADDSWAWRTPESPPPSLANAIPLVLI